MLPAFLLSFSMIVIGLALWRTSRNGARLQALIREDDGAGLRRLLVRKPRLLEAPIFGDVTPLHLAASVGSVHATRELLSQQADPNVRRDDGTRPLAVAAACGNVPVMVQLLEWGASIDAGDCHGRTALHRAVEAGQLQATLTLLEAWAHPNLMDATHKTPLDVAERIANPVLTKALLSHGGAHGYRPGTPAPLRDRSVRPTWQTAS